MLYYCDRLQMEFSTGLLACRGGDVAGKRREGGDPQDSSRDIES